MPFVIGALLVLVLAALLGLRGRRRFVVGQSLVWLATQVAGGVMLAVVTPQLLRARYWLPVTLPVAVLAAVVECCVSLLMRLLRRSAKA